MKTNLFNLTDRFDAKRFCDESGTWSGEIGAEQLDRVLDFAEIDSPFTATLKGFKSEHAQRRIEMTAHGQLTIMCERCARDFLLEVDTRAQLWIAGDEAEIESIESTVSGDDDVILASDVVSAIQLLEDEVLLAIPFSPRCEKVDCEVVKI
jgi:Large ribosomal RNA subunit accumulation protein YceD